MRAFITSAEFKLAKKPIVYMWKRGEEWLYVGMSTVGISRIFTPDHHVLHSSEMQEGDSINWSYFDTVKEAQIRERFLISKYQPLYNITYTKRLSEKMRKLHDTDQVIV